MLLAAVLTIGCHYLLEDVRNIYVSLFLKIVLVSVSYVVILWAAGSVILKESMSYLFSKEERSNHEKE